MANEDFQPKDSIVLSSDGAIRAYVHPVRMDILKRLGREELTLSQLALAMDTVPANLSRHVKRLLDSGLAKFVRSRDTGKNFEKYYRAAAKAFRVELPGRPEDKAATALSILRDSLEEALSRDSPSLEGSLACIVSLRLDKRRKEELIARLGRLVEEYSRYSEEKGESLLMSLALYPGEASPARGEKIVI
jgi:DNA-binding transcriptional ArsR family regulator